MCVCVYPVLYLQYLDVIQTQYLAYPAYLVKLSVIPLSFLCMYARHITIMIINILIIHSNLNLKGGFFEMSTCWRIWDSCVCEDLDLIDHIVFFFRVFAPFLHRKSHKTKSVCLDLTESLCERTTANELPSFLIRTT